MNTFTVLALIALLATVLACAWLVRRYRGSKLMANTYNPPNAGIHDTGNISYYADAAIGRYKLVIRGAGANGKLAVESVAIGAGATEKPLGVTDDEISTDESVAGQKINVKVLGAVRGTVLMTAGAAIALDAFVQSNGDGNIKTAVSTGYIVGQALQAAQAAGDVIEVIPIKGTVALA